ncbi:MAG TPA: VWA domain-containing protein [Myxococcota bacterium]|nr:VWA domain-containing protein [Myxococcota bacterium]
MLDELIHSLEYFLDRYDLQVLHPAGFLLLLSIPVFIVLGLWMDKGMRWYRRLAIVFLRVALVTFLACALSRPVKISRQKSPAVVLLADLSASISQDERRSMERKIRDFWSGCVDADCYLVGFGDLPRLLALPGTRRIDIASQPVSNVTDISDGLRFAEGLFPKQHDKRLVIFSDGNETRGNLGQEVEQARRQGIEIYTVPIIPAASDDVRVVGISAPATVRVGEKVRLAVEITSSARRLVSVGLLIDGRRAGRKKLSVGPGQGRAEFEISLPKAGWHEITGAISASADRYPQNNRAAVRIHVSARPRVLLVQAARGENPLKSVLGKQDLDLVSTDRENIPALAELAAYDLVIMDDLPLQKFSARVVDELRGYVESQGGGLLIAAGSAAAELAGPDDAPIESLLPVQFRQVKKKEKIPAALAFVLDRSASMGRGRKFSILLRAVVDTLDRLKDTAQVAVIMFDDFPEMVVGLTEARQRKKIRRAVLAQRVGGGTSIYPALEFARRELRKSAAKLKHVILLSDGQSISIYAHFGYLVDKIARDKITITAIALGQDADQAELKRISSRSGGRFYYADSMDNVPKIFTAETEQITEDNVVKQPIRAVPAKLASVIAGIDFSTAPPVKGYLPSEARPTSEVLLKTSDRSEPLLIRWRYGLGRVTLVASDAQGAWAGDWTGWEGFGVLWPRLVKDTLRSAPPGDIRLRVMQVGSKGVVTVEVPVTNAVKSASAPELAVIDPSGKETDLTLSRRGLGLYRADFPLQQIGAYAFRAQRVGRGGAQEIAYASLSHTYQEEYLSAVPNTELLRQTGRLDPKPDQVFAPGRLEREKRKERWPPLAFGAMILFLLEVMLRRL